jgi:LemA protein
MTLDQIAAWAIAAILLFWLVGAYNRLVRLRQSILRRFVPVEEQLRARNASLQRMTDALAASDPALRATVDALRAACAQADSACIHARAHPGAAGAVTSLRMAEEILADQRRRLPAGRWNSPDLAALAAEVAACDTTLVFAQRQFNDVVHSYNAAVTQFPTWLVAGLFGFRAAGTL